MFNDIRLNVEVLHWGNILIVFQNEKSSPATKQQIEELKLLRDALVANFKEQMKLRWGENYFNVWPGPEVQLHRLLCSFVWV